MAFLIFLAKIRPDESGKKYGFAESDTLLHPPDFSPIRRNTTDLSAFLENENASEISSPDIVTHHLSPNESSVTVRLRRSRSFNEDASSNSGPEDDLDERSKTPSPIPTFKATESAQPPSDALEASKKTSVKNGSSSSLTGTGTVAEDDLPLSPSPTVKKKTKRKKLVIKGVQEVIPEPMFPENQSLDGGDSVDNSTSSADVAFIIQVKSTRARKKGDDDDTMSLTTATDTTETTLIDTSEPSSSGLSLWEFDEMKKELERLRDKCGKLEKEKADILARRVSSLEAPKTQSGEFLKLQQKVNQLTTINEDLKDEQKHLESRVHELEKELTSRPTGDFFQRCISELRSKLANAEAEIEKVNEEKRETEQQMNDMQDEFEELQDSFHGDKSEEYATIKKELDDSNKSCRVLQFKLRKAEKRIDAIEAEKKELELTLETSKNTAKIYELEEELAKSKAENEKLIKESFKSKKNDPQLSPRLGGTSPSKKKSPVLTKAPSGEFVDPPMSGDIDSAQLLRDLQSTIERESDVREQLKFAEEEVNSLRQKMSRIEDENESLLIQIKKISSSPKGAKDVGRNPIPLPTTSGEKLDPTELKLQLELNEQESKILRRKVEELEKLNHKLTKDYQKIQEELESAKKEDKQSITKSKNVEEVSILRRKIIEKEREVERLEAELQAAKVKPKLSRSKSLEVEESKAELRRLQDELTKTKLDAKNSIESLEDELSKASSEIEAKDTRIFQLNESNETLVAHIETFKKEIGKMKEHYEAIQADFSNRNAKLATEKQALHAELATLRQGTETLEKELKALRETFNSRQDNWIKEKLKLQEQMEDLESRGGNTNRLEPNIPGGSLKKLLKDQSVELESKRREIQTYKDQILFMQKENDGLRKQMEDFEKLSQVQIRSISANDPNSKSEVKAIRERLQMGEKTHRNELAQLKLAHDQAIASKSEELSSLQSQLSRAKRERDTFRQMVDSAQRAIAELKSKDSIHRKESLSGLEEAAEGARAAVNTLRERVQSLEDELSDSRRETARAKTEVVTERSTWEMKLAELQQKVNELEEDRLMGSGRTRAAGQRTRLELAWQKEREEQQRRLKEATTLARDLKTTLQEIERERDREKIEHRRRIDQIKAALEEEQEDLRRKVGESHSDLLELRDAHAKLRTANEKLRRDREKLEKERELLVKKELEARRHFEEQQGMINELLQRISSGDAGSVSEKEVSKLIQNVKQLQQQRPNGDESADRKRSAFRRAASSEGSAGELTVSSSAYGREQYGVAGAVGRAAMKYSTGNLSTLSVPTSSSVGSSGTSGRMSRSTAPQEGKGKARGKSVDKTLGIHGGTGSQAQGNLYRKSLSLEQNVSMPDEQKIWKGESDAGSGSSLGSLDSRGSSIDRFSSISSKSEKPKSKSLVSKVKKLVKSRSIEEPPTSSARSTQSYSGMTELPGSNSGSISSINSEQEREPKPKLKDRVKGIFRRTSRSPSVERARTAANLPEPPPRASRETTPKKPGSHVEQPRSASQQRPLMPTESSNVQKQQVPQQPQQSSTLRRF